MADTDPRARETDALDAVRQALDHSGYPCTDDDAARLLLALNAADWWVRYGPDLRKSAGGNDG